MFCFNAKVVILSIMIFKYDQNKLIVTLKDFANERKKIIIHFIIFSTIKAKSFIKIKCPQILP